MTARAGSADRTAPQAAPGKRRPLSTGFKLFLILSLALLPLGLIAFLATLQSNRSADLERQAQLRIAVSESSRKLAAALAADVATVRAAMAAFESRPGDAGICPRLGAILATEGPGMPRFAVFGASSAPLCVSPGFRPERPSTLSFLEQADVRASLADDGLALAVPGGSGASVLAYPVRTLATIGAPGEFLRPYALSLTGADERLVVVQAAGAGAGGIGGTHSAADPLGVAGLAVEMQTARDPFSLPEILSLLLPLLMWAAAAAIGWLVVNRVLIGPLRELEREVSGYQPGEVIRPVASHSAAAHELNQLGDTFHDITRMVANHEAELAEGLARQTKLTREVHHRVKNNLQVIASLISLHARGQKSPEVIRAYTSIQRRVDALAVVHRNHFAELEVNRGVSLRALIGELARNIRGSLPENETAPPIALDICACFASQDVAVPVAFILTELIELSMTVDTRAPIAVSLKIAELGRARLEVKSAGLAASPALEERLADRFGRVLEGLARQLRTPLDRDPETGRFCVLVAVVVDEEAHKPL